MFRPRFPRLSERRRAVILMVVLVLLTLFAVIGLTFVLYANNEADSSRIYREANSQTGNTADVSPQTLANYAFGQLLFDVPTPLATAANPTPTAGFSAMRGYSFVRDLYAWNDDLPGSNIYAFNGYGRQHSTTNNPWNVDDHALLSYVPWLDANGNPLDGFFRDPERLGTRASLANPWGPFTAGWNSSYTYPDGNHVYLGAYDADGNILARSFWRPYLLPQTIVGNNPTGNVCLPLNPNDPSYWTWFQNTNPSNAAETVPPSLRYASLRPRPADMAPGFPAPGLGGDVRNLPPPASPTVFAGNDSVWIDLDFPIQYMADGTAFKPLFAFHISELDGRVNVNTHGNVRGANLAHLSSQGWGKWGVNLGQVLSNPGANGSPEWPQVFVGSANSPTTNVWGRYGADMRPAVANSQAPSGQTPRVYGQVDFDEANDGQGGALTAPITIPSPFPYSSFPFFPAGYSNGAPLERTNHPSDYDSQYPQGDDTRFAASSHIGLFQNSTAALQTPLGQLLPINFSSQNNYRIRNMLTLESASVDTPALTAWMYDRNGPPPQGTNANPYGYLVAGSNSHMPPSAPATNYPSLALRANPLPTNTEFSVDWRSVDAALGKVDLNRWLPPYPHLGQGTNPAPFNAVTNPSGYLAVPMTNTPNDRFDDGGPLQAQFTAATQARQQFANDIYRRLLRVTGVASPANPAAPTANELAPRRWLAQLAANIVDFIDEDEISTPFNFYGTVDGLAPASVNATSPTSPEFFTYWVFGTELPKVLLNEVMAEYKTPLNMGAPQTGVPFPVRVFAELFCPLPSAAQASNNAAGAYPGTIQGQDTVSIALWIPAAGANAGYSPYIVAIADTNGAAGSGGLATPGTLAGPITDNNNVLGTPDVLRSAAVVSGEFNPLNGGVKTIEGNAANSSIAPQQFVMVAPTGGTDYNNTFQSSANAGGLVPPGTVVVSSSNMQYNVQLNAAANQWQFVPAGGGATPLITDGPTPVGTASTGITVLLRRLTNPHMPPTPAGVTPADVNGNPNPLFNPYVTTDYMQKVPPHDAANQTAYYASTPKSQPYAANTQTYYNQTIPAFVAGTPTTVWTPGSYNTTGAAVVPYNWLTHLDRQLISPIELLHVSGFHPHELTTLFVSPNGGGGPLVAYNHRVNWYNETSRLYRAFEFLGTRDRAAGVSWSGRRPGQININTIWNAEVFNALCDAQGSNSFTPAQIAAIYQQMVALRSPGMVPPNPAQPGWAPQVTGQDRPFMSFGVGNQPANDPMAVFDNGTPKTNSTGQASNTGVEDTFFRSFGGTVNADGSANSTTQRLFDVPGAAHPYQTTELMTKIFNNTTTRSNVFAVWVTVGFFRVPNPTTAQRPIPLAEEIGAATGTNIRHQLFAIVDRSKMAISRRPITTIATPAPATSIGQPSVATLTATNGIVAQNQIPWQVQTGSMLVIDIGTPQEETVVVSGVAAGNVIATTFAKAHGVGATVTIPGNPGPQPTFSMTAPGFSGVVLAYTVLK